jgi:hypothetical protein
MSEFRRKQVVSGDPRQILRPDQLAVGQELAVAYYDVPLSKATRFALGTAMMGVRAALSLPIREQRAAFRKGWETEAVGGLAYSLWRGQVEEVRDADAVALLTHGMIGDWDAAYAEPSEIPPITSDFTPVLKRVVPFHEMGLSPIAPGHDGAGKWLPNVAIAL